MDRIKEKYNGADFDDKNSGGLIPTFIPQVLHLRNLN